LGVHDDSRFAATTPALAFIVRITLVLEKASAVAGAISRGSLACMQIAEAGRKDALYNSGVGKSAN